MQAAAGRFLLAALVMAAPLAGGATVIAAVLYAMMPARPPRPATICEEMT